MTNVQADVLALFNCIVVEPRQKVSTPHTEFASQGLVLDFQPTEAQLAVLRTALKPLPMNTLFTKEERLTADPDTLIVKQILHYVEVYGLGMPGLFDLTTNTGAVVSLNYVRGITVASLESKIQALLYENAPVKDAKQVARIIEAFGLTFALNHVKNNELRVLLWQPKRGAFTNGDDAVRWLCMIATGDMLLIKSKEVLAKVKKTEYPASFFEMHTLKLAEVFNRHKAIILAAKDKHTRTVINRIARLSKVAHVPVQEPVAKSFVHRALAGEAGLNLNKIGVRDKLKFLNVLAEKRLQKTHGQFVIRNGKIWYRDDRRVYDKTDILRVERAVLTSLQQDLAGLKDKTILFDARVDYGLPTTRKQTLGRLPFGTKVKTSANEISAGMYWENSWGATDLDLSGITLEGKRVGWGQSSGYTDRDIIFSGDLTDASRGAMEFMTSRTPSYGLGVNIYSGGNGSEMELVVGQVSKTNRQWMDDVIIREKHKLDSRNCLIGFVKGKDFVVYAGRLNNRIVSGVNPSLRAMEIEFWTVQRLFSAIGIAFDVDRQEDVEYDHDLSYESFSFDKLEGLLNTA